MKQIVYSTFMHRCGDYVAVAMETVEAGCRVRTEILETFDKVSNEVNYLNQHHIDVPITHCYKNFEAWRADAKNRLNGVVLPQPALMIA